MAREEWEDWIIWSPTQTALQLASPPPTWDTSEQISVHSSEESHVDSDTVGDQFTTRPHAQSSLTRVPTSSSVQKWHSPRVAASEHDRRAIRPAPIPSSDPDNPSSSIAYQQRPSLGLSSRSSVFQPLAPKPGNPVRTILHQNDQTNPFVYISSTGTIPKLPRTKRKLDEAERQNYNNMRRKGTCVRCATHKVKCDEKILCERCKKQNIPEILCVRQKVKDLATYDPIGKSQSVEAKY